MLNLAPGDVLLGPNELQDQIYHVTPSMVIMIPRIPYTCQTYKAWRAQKGHEEYLESWKEFRRLNPLAIKVYEYVSDFFGEGQNLNDLEIAREIARIVCQNT